MLEPKRWVIQPEGEHEICYQKKLPDWISFETAYA